MEDGGGLVAVFQQTLTFRRGIFSSLLKKTTRDRPAIGRLSDSACLSEPLGVY